MINRIREELQIKREIKEQEKRMMWAGIGFALLILITTIYG